MELRPGTTDRRVRGKDTSKVAEGDGVRPQDEIPLRREEDAGAEVAQDDRRRDVQGATGEAKLDEEEDVSDIGVRIDSSGNRVQEQGFEVKFDTQQSEDGEYGFGDDQSKQSEDDTEYWNVRMSEPWHILEGFRSIFAVLILMLGTVRLPTVAVPQQAPSSAHNAEIARFRALAYTVEQVSIAIPELASRRMSAKMMSNFALLYDKSTGVTGLFALIVATTLNGFLHARGSISGMNISRVDPSDEHLEDYDDDPYAVASSCAVNSSSSDTGKFYFSQFDSTQVPSIVPLLSTFRRCQELDPKTQTQVLRFNREIGKRVLDTNILTTQARNDIQVQGEAQLAFFRLLRVCGEVLESKGDPTGTTYLRQLEDLFKTHAKRYDPKAHCDPYTAISKSLGYTPVIGQIAFDLLLDIFHKKGDHNDSLLIGKLYFHEYRAPSGAEAQIAEIREMLANAKATVMAPIQVTGETPRPHPAVQEHLIVDSFIASLEFCIKSGTGLTGYPKELRDLERLAQRFRDLQLRLGDKIRFEDLLVIVSSESAKNRCGPLPGYEARTVLAAQKSQKPLSVPVSSPPAPPPQTATKGIPTVVKFLRTNASELLCHDPKSKQTFLKLGQSGASVVSLPPELHSQLTSDLRLQLSELRQASKIFHGLDVSASVGKSRTPDKSNSKGQIQGKGYRQFSSGAKGQSQSGKGKGYDHDRGKGYSQHSYQHHPQSSAQPPYAKGYGKSGGGESYSPQPWFDRGKGLSPASGKGKGGHSRAYVAEVAPVSLVSPGEEIWWEGQSSVDAWQDEGPHWPAIQDEGGAAAFKPKKTFAAIGHDPGLNCYEPRLSAGKGDARVLMGHSFSPGEDELVQVVVRRSQLGKLGNY